MNDYLTLPPDRARKLRRVIRVLDDPTPTRDRRDERREHERIPFEFPLLVTWTDAEGQPHAAKARGLNVCYGGISMTIKDTLERRQLVTVFIPEPEGPARRMTARVVFCRPVANIHEAGLQFVRQTVKEHRNSGTGEFRAVTIGA